MYSPAGMARPIPSPDKPIVLVGLMGAGKSTIGRRLAKRLRMPFADSDDAIEEAAHRSIAEIFEEYGEESFRDGERRVIARLIEGAPKVIATGGGAFMNDRTRALILQNAVAIWLDADVEILAERVARRGHRPLLKDKEALPFLRDLAAIRNPIYAEAHIHIRTQPMPHDRAVAAIVEALNAWRAAA
jgi:shikimate kinase